MERRNEKALELKLLRVTRGEIAEALNMSPTTVGDYFKGKPVSQRTQDDIERYLGELRSKRSNPQSGGPEAA